MSLISAGSISLDSTFKLFNTKQNEARKNGKPDEILAKWWASSTGTVISRACIIQKGTASRDNIFVFKAYI
jgi:hypothetical protein